MDDVRQGSGLAGDAPELPQHTESSTTERAAGLLREVLALVDAGELQASSSQRAHLAGAVATLETLTRP